MIDRTLLDTNPLWLFGIPRMGHAIMRMLINKRLESGDAMNTIDITMPVAQLVKEHPDLLPILIDLGFKPLAKPAMRNTVGQVTSLKTGSRLTGIPLEKIIQELKWNGYDVVEGDRHDE